MTFSPFTVIAAWLTGGCVWSALAAPVMADEEFERAQSEIQRICGEPEPVLA